MTHIIAREEFRSGLYLALFVPWNGIEFGDEREFTVATLMKEIADVLAACADPDEALAAIRAAREAAKEMRG